MINVRFAPSPTGYLHIGSARIALINYLFAKKSNGKFHLRIEDTDKERSKSEYINTIYDSLKWLNLESDSVVIQSQNESRHKEVALTMLQKSNAYYCFCSQEDLEADRNYCMQNSLTPKYNKKCRNLTPDVIEQKLNFGVKPVIRIKVPETDEYIEVNDLIKEKSKVYYKDLDDFIILRSNSTPTYMLSVVVDDHDMNITHVIRGEDHFTNTFRQIIIYKACEWNIPIFAHVPLILGSDGKKLSKRTNSISTFDYKNLGYLSSGLKTYLSIIGTKFNSKNDFEYITKNFNIKQIGNSASQFDIAILNSVNQHCFKKLDKKYVLAQMIPFIENKINVKLNDEQLLMLTNAYDDITSRSKNLIECSELTTLYFYPDVFDINLVDKEILEKISLINIDYSSPLTIKKSLVDYCEKLVIDINNNFDLVSILNTLRIVLTGRDNCPNIYNIMFCIGEKETRTRILRIL
jgi:glutamyl-tRNA synthetase